MPFPAVGACARFRTAAREAHVRPAVLPPGELQRSSCFRAPERVRDADACMEWTKGTTVGALAWGSGVGKYARTCVAMHGGSALPLQRSRAHGLANQAIRSHAVPQIMGVRAHEQPDLGCALRWRACTVGTGWLRRHTRSICPRQRSTCISVSLLLTMKVIAGR